MLTRILKKAKTTPITDKKCDEAMKKQGGAPPITEGMMCAGDGKGEVDSCQVREKI